MELLNNIVSSLLCHCKPQVKSLNVAVRGMLQVPSRTRNQQPQACQELTLGGGCLVVERLQTERSDVSSVADRTRERDLSAEVVKSFRR